MTLAKVGGSTALGGRITVQQGSSLNYSNQDYQFAEGAELVINGGAVNFNNRSERLASYTQTSGGMTGSNTGNVVVDGTFRMSGGSVYTINSNGSLSAEKVDLRGMAGNINSLNVGGAGTRNTSAVNVGSGGLHMDGQKIQFNYATAEGQLGSRLNLGGDLFTTGENVIDSPGASFLYEGVRSQIELGITRRTFDIGAGSLRLQNLISIQGSGGLVKKGEGSLIFALAGAANTVSVGQLILEAGKITHTQHHVLDDELEVQITGGKYELGGRTETLGRITMSAGQFESGNFARLTLSDGFASTGGTFTVNSGAILSTNSLSLAGTSVAIGGSSTANITQIAVGGGGFQLHGQSLTLSRSTDASHLGLEFVLEGNLTTTGTSSLAINTTAALLGNSKTQLRIEGEDRVVNVTGTFTLRTPLAGSGSWIKQGEGLMKLSGAHHNPYSGKVVVEAGQLDLQKTDGVHAIANILDIRGGKVFFQTSNQIHDLTGSIHQSGGILDLNHRTETLQDYIKAGGTVMNNAGNITILGTFKGIGGTSMSEVASNPIYTINSGGHTYARTLDFSESIKSYALLLGGNSTVVTKFTVGEGGLKLNSNQIVLNRDTSGSELVLNGDVSATGSNQFTRGALGASGSRIAQIQQGNATRAWHIGDGTTMVDMPIVGDGAGLTKTGAGSLELREISTYSGKSDFQAGTVKLTAAAGLSQTSWIELGAAAVFDVTARSQGFQTSSSSAPILSGDGLIRGNLQLGQGTSLRPGASLNPLQMSRAGAQVGTLTLQGNLLATQSSENTVLFFNIQDGQRADQLTISGDLTLNAHSKISVSFDQGYAGQVGDAWTLLEWSGVYHNQGFNAGLSGRTGENLLAEEGQLDLPTLMGGLYWHLDSMDLRQGLRLSIVPEPRASVLATCAIAALLLRRRRGASSAH